MQLYALLFGCWASIFVHKYAEYANGLGDRENRWRKKKKKMEDDEYLNAHLSY